jgi:hypothetical protein
LRPESFPLMQCCGEGACTQTKVPSRGMVGSLKRSRATRLERTKRPLRRLVPGRALKWMLPHATFAVKSVTVILTGATVTLLLWRSSDPAAFHSSEADRFSAAFAPFTTKQLLPQRVAMAATAPPLTETLMPRRIASVRPLRHSSNGGSGPSCSGRPGETLGHKPPTAGSPASRCDI